MNCTHVLGRLLPGGCLLCVGQAEAAIPIATPLPPTLGEERILEQALTLARVDRIPSVLVVSPDDEIDLSGEAAEDMLRELDRDACVGSLSEFVKLAFLVVQSGVDLEWGPHLQAVCDHVQWQLEDRDACTRDPMRKRRLKAQNLLVNLPPRSLKTIILTCATVWAWLRWPTLKIMYLSANPRVASSSARMARDLIRSEWFRTTFAPRWGTEYLDGATGDPITAEEWEARNPVEPEAWEIRSDQDALSDLGNTSGGVRIARGLSSVITGSGADWLLIDDPHDVRDGHDKVAKAVEDYDSAVHNRTNDPRTSIRTLIMQRCRPNDLSAKWLTLPSMLHVRLPMEFELPYEIDCKCGTCVGVNAYGFSDWRSVRGESLHPHFFDAIFIANEKARLLSRYVGQHQQRPLEPGGQVFKVAWWNWHSLTDEAPKARPKGARTSPAFVIGRRRDGSLDLDGVDISVDATGGSTSDDASNLGIGVIGRKDERRFLLRDLTAGPATWLQTMEQLKNAVLVAAKICGKQPKLTVLVEAKAFGKAAIEQLEKHILDGDLRYPDGTAIRARVEPYEPSGKGDKATRIELMEPDIAAGLVYLEDGEHETSAFRDEVEGYPKASKNDRCDYLAQALDHRRKHVDDWRAFFKERREAALAQTRAASVG